MSGVLRASGVLSSAWVTGASAPEQLVTIWPGISYPNCEDLQGRDTLDATALQTATLIWRVPDVLTILVIVGAAASLWPVRQAARIDPSMALRSE